MSANFLLRAWKSASFSGFTLTVKTSRYSPCARTATGAARHTTTVRAPRAFRNDITTSSYVDWWEGTLVRRTVHPETGGVKLSDGGNSSDCTGGRGGRVNSELVAGGICGL